MNTETRSAKLLDNSILAERVGFEPTLEFPLNTLSKRAPSTTRPSLLKNRLSLTLASNPKCGAAFYLIRSTFPYLLDKKPLRCTHNPRMKPAGIEFERSQICVPHHANASDLVSIYAGFLPVGSGRETPVEARLPGLRKNVFIYISRGSVRVRKGFA